MAEGGEGRRYPAGSLLATAFDEFVRIRDTLATQGLLRSDALVRIAHDGVRATLDAGGKPVPCNLLDHVRAPYALVTGGPYSLERAARGLSLEASLDDVAQMFGHRVRYAHAPVGDGAACLLPGRGFLVTGRHVDELVTAALLMEKACRVEALAGAIGGTRPLGRILCVYEHHSYLTSYSRPAMELVESAGNAAPVAAPSADADPAAVPSPDVDHLDLRLAVIRHGRRLVEEGLIQATWGNVSVRAGDGFLITPSGVDYWHVRPQDVTLVSVADGSFAPGLHPSSERRMHQAIYQARPDVRAIIHTHSSNCAVFAACNRDLVAEGLECPCAEYGRNGTDALAANVAGVMRCHDGCVMANHGFVACGASLEDALRLALEAELRAGELLGVS